MNPKKQILICAAAWILLGLTFFNLAIEVSPWFFIPVLLLAVLVNVVYSRIKCPFCGTKIMIRKRGLAGMPIALRGWPPKECPDCGKPL
jgi:DNA-directed RNA polymerase subunit RPC12/RpoP